MSHSNETLHYGLSQYVGTDIINPLTDFNGDNNKIDEALYDANVNANDAKEIAQTASSTVGQFDDRITALEQGESGSDGRISSTQHMIAPTFDPLKSGGYAIGDKVVYEDKLYEFIRAHSGAWSASDVDEKAVVEMLGEGGGGDYDSRITHAQNDATQALADAASANAGVTATQAMISIAFDPNKVGGYSRGDLVTYNDKLYEFTTAHTGAWNSAHAVSVKVADLLNSTTPTSATNRNERNIICIGDSYGQWIEGDNISWISALRDRLQNLKKFYHMEEGGAGFLGDLYGESQYRSFKALLQTLEGTITNKSEITDIVVCGGYNDYSAGRTYIDQLPAKINEFITYAKALYPNAVVWIGCIARSSRVDICQGLLETIYLNYLVGCRNYGGAYLSGIELVLHSDNQMRDESPSRVHPNDQGSLDLGFNIAQLMVGQRVSVYSPPLNIAGVTNFFTASGLIEWCVYGDRIEITLPAASYTFVSGVSLTFDSTFKAPLFALNACPYIHAFNSPSVAVDFIIVDNNNVFHKMTGTLSIEDKIVYLVSHEVDSTGTAWLTIGCQQMIMNACTINISAYSC